MKLRINGNSLRLRVSRSEVHLFIDTGQIEEAVHFSLNRESRLTYVLKHEEQSQEISVRYQPQEITVVLSSGSVRRWANSIEEVGIYGRVPVCGGELILLVEKDFACLDGTDAENRDTFPNPQSTAVC